MNRLLILPVLLLSLLVGTPAFSADFLKGVDFYNRGDYETALREWKPLAKQGDADAQFNLGLMYEKRRGVPQNYQTAVKWYRLAAEQRHVFAQNNLGFMYGNGRGVVQDYVRAHMWFNLAASTGKKVPTENRDIFAEKMTPANISKTQ